MGEGGGRLSGGQQQRVNLARAMLKRGTIYLLDEPTTGLDPDTRYELLSILQDIAWKKKKTVIITTHHLDEAEIFSNNLVT